jgi:hypothetical protein
VPAAVVGRDYRHRDGHLGIFAQAYS